MAYSKAQKEQYKQEKQREQAELLARAVDNLMSSEGFRKYLDSRARFHKYSFFNTILIAMQRPDATMVTGKGGKKGTSGWKALGRAVKEDEKPIKILAPNFVYERDAKTGDVIKQNGKPVIRFVWYKVVDVYDYAQTEGDPLPEPPAEYGIEGDSAEEYLYRLVRFAGDTGLKVDFRATGDAALDGYTILLNGKRPINAQVYDLTSILAEQAEADLSDYGREERAAIREAATYLACRQMGLDTSGVAVPVLAKLSGLQAEKDKERVNLMREFATKVDDIANTITEGVL
jgi:hypothetical protein